MKIKIRAEWGFWSNYADIQEYNPPYLWDGKLDVKRGNLLSLNQLRFWGLFGPGREEQTPSTGNSWKSRIRPGENRGWEGIVFEVEGDGTTSMVITFRHKKVKFLLGEILSRRWVEINIGPKYSCTSLIISVDGYNPFISGRNEIEAGGGFLVEAEEFRGAALQKVFFRVPCAWIKPQEKIEAEFSLPDNIKKGERSVILKAMVADPRVGEKIDESLPGDGGVWKKIRLAVLLNGRRIYWGSHYFSSLRSCQKLEEIEFEIDSGYLKSGTNSLAVRNEDDLVYLLVNRVIIQRNTVSSGRLPSKSGWQSKRQNVHLGLDLGTAVKENGQIDYILNYLKDTGLGDYILFRPEDQKASVSDWERWAKICFAKGIYFALEPEVFRSGGKIPHFRQVIDILKQHGGKYFLGLHFHEWHSNLIYGWGKKPPLRERKGRSMLDARNSYLDRVRERYRGLPSGVGRIIGEALPVQHYDYMSGVDICQSEIMIGHAMLLLSAGRGAAKAYGKKVWGAHVACHIHRFPQDEKNERMWRLSLYLSYFYGAKIIYDEESAITMFHGEKYSFNDKLPLRRREIMREFNGFIKENPLGQPLVNIGVVQGNLGVFVGGSNIGRKPVKVWGGLGPESKGWEYSTPEEGWRYLDILLPGVWLSPLKQDYRKVRHWFSGTPYGQVDLVPSEAPLDIFKTYRCLIFLGWNTMTEELYDKINKYVISGGILFMGLPQLSTHTNRDFLYQGGNLKLFRNGDFQKLFGVDLPLPFTSRTKIHYPPLVEHTPGRGKTHLLLDWHYPGYKRLRPFVSRLLRTLAENAQGDVRMEDKSNEVSYFVFQDEGVKRIYLVNTDWTEPDNIKKVKLFLGDKSILTGVKEGRPVILEYEPDTGGIVEIQA